MGCEINWLDLSCLGNISVLLLLLCLQITNLKFIFCESSHLFDLFYMRKVFVEMFLILITYSENETLEVYGIFTYIHSMELCTKYISHRRSSSWCYINQLFGINIRWFFFWKTTNIKREWNENMKHSNTSFCHELPPHSVLCCW